MPAASNTIRPPERSWTVAIYVDGQGTPKGSGVLIDRDRVLTCRHVIEGSGPEELSVGFPAAIEDPYRDPHRVARVDAAEHARADVAVLTLAEQAPSDAAAAPLRRPRAADLVGSVWWAYGFHDDTGNATHGTVGEDLTYGWIRIDSESRYHLEKGFSGAGLWCSDYGAVVGLVGQALHATGDGRAVTMNAAASVLRHHDLAALADAYRLDSAGPEAAEEWGWQLATDDEGRRHWRPRARGVTHEAEAGWRFRGRRAALTRIINWLTADHVPRTPLVITGSPGAGKSAVLARIVTTADFHVAQALPPDDTAMRAPVGSVACAVHAKGKTALEVARELARATSAEIPDSTIDTVSVVRDALVSSGVRRRFTIVIDALDEATTPAEARAIIHDVLRPLVENCADLGVRALVGTRRRDDDGELTSSFGASRNEIDLDDPDFIDPGDLAAYALVTLQLGGDARPDNPYLDNDVAQPVAERIATVSAPNFLVAGLLARQHGLHDVAPVPPQSIDLPENQDRVKVAFDRYLGRMNGIAGLTPAQLLLPLAYAETPGLSAGLWGTAITALTGTSVDDFVVHRFLSGAAANFLIKTSDATGSFRLFHQALNDSLVRERPAVEDQRTLVRAFLQYGKRLGWNSAPAYISRSLGHHALAGDDIDTVLADLIYVLHADLTRLIPAGASAQSAPARAIATLIRRSPQAIGQGTAERLSILKVTDAIDRLDTGVRAVPTPSPYWPAWAQAQPRGDLATLTGHTDGVNAVCAVTVDGRSLLASAGEDATVRLWDPATGQPERELTGHTGRINALCAQTVNGRSLLASAGADATVRLWDPATGQPERELTGHTGRVNGMCAVTVDGRSLLASASADDTVRLWDPATGQQERELTGHTDWARAVCAVTVDGRSLLASAGADATVRLWDPATGQQKRELIGHTGRVNALCAQTVNGRSLLASAGADATVRLWDPATGQQERELIGHTGRVNAVCAVTVDGRSLLASASADDTVRLWDPATGQQERELTGHTDWVNAVCAVTVDGRSMLASAAADRTVRLWGPGTGHQERELTGHTDWVNAVCAVTVDGRSLLVSASDDDTMRLWDPATGHQERELTGHAGWVRAVCAVTLKDGRSLLASAGADDTVRLWDPATGRGERELTGHTGKVRAVCAVTVDGRFMLASAGADRTVRLWDPATGHQERKLTGHTSRVTAVCAVTVDGRSLLASAGADRTVRLWDPAAGRGERKLTGHTGGIRGLCPVMLGAGRSLLASASADRTVRLWDPATGQQERNLTGHTDCVNSVCAVTVDGRSLLASASDDRTVQLWNPVNGRPLLRIPLRDLPCALTSEQPGTLFIGLDVGVLMLRLTASFLEDSQK